MHAARAALLAGVDGEQRRAERGDTVLHRLLRAVPSATTAITAPTPITMPSIVSSDRSLFARSAPNAMCRTSNRTVLRLLRLHRGLGLGILGRFLLLGGGRFMLERHDLAGDGAHLHFVDAALPCGLDVVGENQLAVLPLELDALDLALRNALLRGGGGDFFGDLGLLDQRIRKFALVASLGVRRRNGERRRPRFRRRAMRISWNLLRGEWMLAAYHHSPFTPMTGREMTTGAPIWERPRNAAISRRQPVTGSGR